MNATWIAVGVVIAVALGMLVSRIRLHRAATGLKDREPLDDDAIYARYYADSKLPKTLVLQLWHEVADTLKVPASKLRPDDRFGKEIGAYWITSEDLDVLAAKGRERAKALGVSIDLQQLATVNDYVRCLSKQGPF